MIRLFTAILFLAASTAMAGDLSGKVTVLKKGSGKPASNFRHAIVYITGVSTAAPVEPQIQIQEKKQFSPRLLPVVTGQAVDFVNNDSVQHNVFSTDRKNPFDLGRYPSGESRLFTFKKPGIQPVYCDIHQNMVSYIAVMENKYFSRTDDNGNYLIKGVPPGKYKLHVWHIHGGSSEKSIEVTSDPEQYNFTIQSTKLVRDLNDHMNKSGRKYRSYSSEDGDDGYTAF